MKMRNMPAVRSVPPYYDEPVYIEALARSIEKHLARLDFEPEVVIASYHGIPQRLFRAAATPITAIARRRRGCCARRLGWGEKKLITTFQSRFGAQEWLQPYTDKTVEKLAQDGVKSIAVVNPGFSADCIETLEEIAGRCAEIFHHAGGENFAHIPCLNDSDEGMAVIETHGAARACRAGPEPYPHYAGLRQIAAEAIEPATSRPAPIVTATIHA